MDADRFAGDWRRGTALMSWVLTSATRRARYHCDCYSVVRNDGNVGWASPTGEGSLSCLDWPQGEIASRLVRRFGGEVPLFRRPTVHSGMRVWASSVDRLQWGPASGLHLNDMGAQSLAWWPTRREFESRWICCQPLVPDRQRTIRTRCFLDSASRLAQ